MHIDARHIDNNTIIEGDICIIGAGAAGISIALDWIDTPYKVILLEGGGFDYDEKVQKLYKGKNTGQHYFPLMSSRWHSFGGTTALWGGYCSEYDAIDFKQRDWIEHSGWPISKNDLVPFYKKATTNLDLFTDNYSLAYWQEQNPSLANLPLDKNIVWNKMWQFSPPSRFAEKYKDKIINAKNIHLYTYANVTEILTSDEISTVKKVITKNHANKTHTVKANHFILACSAIQNARLLLASNKQQTKGLGNIHDTVGRYFMEHIEIKSSELWLNKPLAMELYLLDWGKTKARAELAITAAVQEEYQLLNGTISLEPLNEARTEESYIEHWNDDDPRNNSFSRSTLEKIKHKISVYNESRIQHIKQAYQLSTRIEQEPKLSSKISLDTTKDSLGVPRSKLHWVLSSLEKKSIRKMQGIIGQQVGISGIGRLKLLDYLHDENDMSWPDYTGGGLHHMGTTRMHNNPKKGVVDAHCKVHTIHNLFIAGSSCFTTSGSANPTLTLIALSLRLSDHLKKNIDSSIIL